MGYRKKRRIRAGERKMYDLRQTRKTARSARKVELRRKDGYAKLEDVIAVCHTCHSVIHIGRTQLTGEEDKAIEQFMRVNKCSYADYRKALGEANARHRKLNEIPEWNLDISWLERFGK